MLVVLFVGLFAFMINWNWHGAQLGFAVLPLGVWILCMALKRKEGRWERYQRFAWLGFWSNYLFLAAAVVAVLLQQWMYPDDQLYTYISSAAHSRLVGLHPSAEEHVTIDSNRLLVLVEQAEPKGVYSDEWYEDLYLNSEPQERKERFPYMLAGANPKWGSGVHPVVFVEQDGKGILVTMQGEQYYFRVAQSVMDKG
ncbi:hypothetical protein [Sporosarcina sp. Te-1]|uniref:hypothetical protein n=1 Tax=Sporosarcina sp. Te-1 TaxID=2818390 RepID=UPI001A9CBBA9|nr:hypothetical protein [Sporosarcina sp. Te-1]QTD39456.1 hypothetical protein J3U78_11270 [Sporosarcina sp. Te-1]